MLALPPVNEIGPGTVVSTYRPGAFVSRASVATAFVSLPRPGRSYAHHPAIAVIGGTLVAMWSQGRRDEDAPGQTAVYAISTDFQHWTSPRAFAPPALGEVQTAGGFLTTATGLVAYIASYDASHRRTRLRAFVSNDGRGWSGARDLGLAVCPNHAPRALASGRLLMAGNFLVPFSDDPSGLAGWTRASFVPEGRRDADEDNPGTFDAAERVGGMPSGLCEGAVLQTDDGVVHLLLRATESAFDGRLRESQSRDEGRTWSRPVRTAFPSDDSKFTFGRLPDGRFYWVGNPGGSGGRGARNPLVLSLSRDGRTFDWHLLLGDDPWRLRFGGRAKGGDYGYPEACVAGGNLYVIASRRKEAIEVFRVPLASLAGGYASIARPIRESPAP